MIPRRFPLTSWGLPFWLYLLLLILKDFDPVFGLGRSAMLIVVWVNGWSPISEFNCIHIRRYELSQQWPCQVLSYLSLKIEIGWAIAHELTLSADLIIELIYPCLEPLIWISNEGILGVTILPNLAITSPFWNQQLDFIFPWSQSGSFCYFWCVAKAMLTGPLLVFILYFISSHALLSIPDTIKIYLTLDAIDSSIKIPAQLRMHVPTENQSVSCV